MNGIMHRALGAPLGYTARTRCYFAAAIALLCLALMLGIAGCFQSQSAAYASVRPAAEATQVADGDEYDDEAVDAEEATSDEQIDEDETPMSSGLPSETPARSGFSFQWIIVAGILGVIGYFAYNTYKLNRSITDMRGNFH